MVARSQKQRAPREERLLQFSGSPGQRFPPDLIAQTEALQERGCLGILPRRVLCPGVGYGRSLRILLLPDPCALISLGPDLCPCILRRADPLVLFPGPDLCRGLLHRPYRRGLRGPGLCPCLFLRRPSLELLEQGFSDRLADPGLALIGRFNSRNAPIGRFSSRSAPIGRFNSRSAPSGRFNSRSALIGRFDSRSNLVARRRVRCGRRQILSVGG